MDITNLKDQQSEVDYVLDMWKKDAEIDLTEPSREILKIPNLHSRYLSVLTKNKIKSKKLMFTYNKMKKLRWEYYTGKLSQEQLDQYKWEPFRFTLKSDISTYIESDPHLVKILQEKMESDEICDVCTAILKELNNRTWQLREYMTQERFIAGAR